jgi:Fe-S cluster assembly iron-binding protein IscA
VYYVCVYLTLCSPSFSCCSYNFALIQPSEVDLSEGDLTVPYTTQGDGPTEDAGGLGPVVVTDDLSLKFIRGAVLDFESDMIRSSFAVVQNPNVDDGCGCGVSFNAPESLFG